MSPLVLSPPGRGRGCVLQDEPDREKRSAEWAGGDWQEHGAAMCMTIRILYCSTALLSYQQFRRTGCALQHANEVCISAACGTRSDTKPPRKPSPRAPLQQSHATAAPCGPFQAWTKPLHPGQAWAQPLRGSGLAHPFHCKTSQPLPVDNCKQLPTAIDCHQFVKNSSSSGQPNSRPFGA